MIICITGTPGSGKTYEIVKKILDNLKLGRTVYTNIDGMDGDQEQEYIKNYCNLNDYDLKKRLNFLSFSDSQRFYEIVKPGSLVVIDETSKHYNAREWNTEKNKQCVSFCSTHRHQGYDVIFITQEIDDVDKQLRGRFEWTYFYRKVNYFGSSIKSKYQVWAYAGENTRKPLQKHVRTYDKRVFKCYKSYVTQDIKEQGFMTHVNILKHPIFYSIPVVLLIFVYFFSKSSYSQGKFIPGQVAVENSVHKQKEPENSPARIAPETKTGVNQESHRGKTKKKQKTSDDLWLITGAVEWNRTGYYLVSQVTDSTRVRYISELYLQKHCECDPKKSGVIGKEYSIPDKDLYYL